MHRRAYSHVLYQLIGYLCIYIHIGFGAVVGIGAVNGLGAYRQIAAKRLTKQKLTSLSHEM